MRKYLLISLLFWSNAYALEIEFYLDSDSYSDLPAGMIMKGEIVQGDYKKLVSVIKKHNRIPGSVLLSSRGGDVLEAIRIGRLMRKGLVTMVVLDLPANGLVNDARSATCESACFLVLAGGVERLSPEPIGIHRPYYDPSYFAGLTADEATSKYKSLDNMVRSYLLEMNVPTKTIDTMMERASDKMSYYETFEILPQKAPAYEEWIKAKCGTFEEYKDYYLLNQAKKIELKGADDAPSKVWIVETVNGFSNGYKKYLIKRNKEHEACVLNATRIERSRILSNI